MIPLQLKEKIWDSNLPVCAYLSRIFFWGTREHCNNEKGKKVESSKDKEVDKSNDVGFEEESLTPSEKEVAEEVEEETPYVFRG